MDRRDRAVLDHQHNSLALGIIEPRGLAWRFAVKQAVRTACVEPQHPIPDDLKPDPADLRRLRARRTVINRRKSQKPPGLRPSFVFRAKPRSCTASKSTRNGIGTDMANLQCSPP